MRRAPAGALRWNATHRRRGYRPAVAIAGLLLAVAIGTLPPVVARAQQPAAAGQPPARRYTTVERMSSTRLAATHRDGDRLREAVRPPPPIAGLTDYRAIFHAHASDSEHTGGTLDELAEDARRVGVQVVFLSDHPRPPRDFMKGWRGLHEGVLFVPGAETESGYLLLPESSVLDHLAGPVGELLAATTAGQGLAFLSHLEDHDPVSFDGVTGTEIYNRHADAKDDAASMAQLFEWMTEPDGVALLLDDISKHPVELFAAQQDYPALYLEAWDHATAAGRRLVGIAANDCHHNQVFEVEKIDDDSVRLGTIVDRDDEKTVFTSATRPRLAQMLAHRDPGEVVARFDLDPYWVSMRFVSTHILARSLDEAAVREAVEAGHVYVGHDWIADPSGFRFYVSGEGGEPEGLLGDEIAWRPGLHLVAEAPLAARFRLLRDGVELGVDRASRLDRVLAGPGVYRVEAWLEVGGELRPWIYSNPIYVRAASADSATGAG